MTDLTANRYIKEWKSRGFDTEKMVVDNTAAVTVYEGEPMIIDIDVDTAYPVPFTSGVTLATGDAFVGIAVTGVTVKQPTPKSTIKLTLPDRDQLLVLRKLDSPAQISGI